MNKNISTISCTITQDKINRSEQEYNRVLKRIAQQKHLNRSKKRVWFDRILLSIVVLCSLAIFIILALDQMSDSYCKFDPIQVIMYSAFAIAVLLLAFKHNTLLKKSMDFSADVNTKTCFKGVKNEFLPFTALYHLGDNNIHYQRQLGDAKKSVWDRPLKGKYFYVSDDFAVVYTAKLHAPTMFIFIDADDKPQLITYLRQHGLELIVLV